MDSLKYFEELPLTIDGKAVTLFYGAFAMDIDKHGNAFVDMVILDTVDGETMTLKPSNESTFKGVIFAMLVAAIERTYRDVLDAYADQFERPDPERDTLGYGHLQHERV